MTNLKISDEDKVVISEAINHGKMLIRRLNMDPMKIPWDTDLESRSMEVAKVDSIIVAVMGKTSSLGKGYYEKTLGLMTGDIDGSESPGSVILWYRMLDTFKYIVSFSKRKNGEDHPGYVSQSVAKSVLTTRGLLKR